MSSTAELIKERLSIVEIVGSYIKLEGAGANFKTKCPFHNERSPSFFVSPARGSYYCFGCGAKGDIFSFVQEYEKVDFLGALKMLAERAGVELREFKSENQNKLERQYKVIDMATRFFQNNLSYPTNIGPLTYLLERGLSKETIAFWRVGFAYDEWRTLMDHMLCQKIDGIFVNEQDLLDVGVIKKTEAEQPGEQGLKGKDKVYDRFRSRIIFPIFDTSGRVIAFSGRIYGKDEKIAGPKYLNSPDMDLFNKSEALYGFDKAKQSMREWGYAILVEGQMDLLMSHQVGVKNTVATSGTSLTGLHLQKIARMTKNVAFMYDGDNAGFNATRRGERLAIELGFDVKVIILPDCEDPASLIKKDKQQFINALKNSTGVIEYHLETLLKKHNNTHSLLKAIEEDLVPDIALTPSAIRRSELISHVSIKSKIPEKALIEEVEKSFATIKSEHGSIDFKNNYEINSINNKKQNNTINQKTGLEGLRNLKGKVTPGLDITLKRTVALLIYIESRNDISTEQIEFYTSSMNQVLSPYDLEVSETLKLQNAEELLFEAEMLYGADPDHLEKNLQELLIELEERSLKQVLTEYMSEIGLAEKVKDKVKSDEIIQKCQKISLKLSELNTKKQNHFKK